jgi:class 3 adenylate cyclase/tetratricopeptide (TPR) repeat protein
LRSGERPKIAIVPVRPSDPGRLEDRRLAAVAFVDIVGYTTLMASDETRTHQRWMRLLSEVLAPQAERCHGSVVKSTGDGILVEFPSAHDAVDWARQVQLQVIPKQIESENESPTISLRIAVHLGDVMTTDFDVFGDGVNVAARLQQYGVPGEVIISEAVYDLVRGTFGAAARDLGLLQLKNLEKPVRAYSLDPNANARKSPRPLSSIDLRVARPPLSGGPAAAVPVPAVSNVPIRVPMHFMGRDDALAEIAAALARHAGRVAITALHGLRGVGKTTLAAAYAERHRGDYRTTWWIRAQTVAGMRADLVALGVRLGWAAADDKEESALAAVMERLRHEGEGVLLIFDNAIDADELRPYLPRGGGARVLVTSNAYAWRGIAEPVEIQLWPREIGTDYLVARSGRENERAAAETLSEALGGLPLAHEQAAAYCERLGISLAEYLKRFEAAPARVLDDRRYAPAEYHDGLTVAKTFGLAIEEAAKLHPAAEPLIVHAALLAPEPIPLFLFAETREKFGEPLATALMGDGLDEAVAALRTFALLNRETIADEHDPTITTETVRLHRLVREVAAARGGGEQRENVRRRLIASLALVYPNDDDINPTSWPCCALLTLHLLTLCETEIADAAANVESADLLARAGKYFFGRGAYSEAQPLHERALSIREEALGPEHPDTAKSLDSLVVVHIYQRDYAVARPLCERALTIREKALGPEHPDTARSLNNLGLLLRHQGDFVQARRINERALAILEKALGPEHPDKAWSLSNLAWLLADQSDFVQARPLFERALAIGEKALGPDHAFTAMSLYRLARLLHLQGNLMEARPLHERALAIREKALGPDHPVTAWSLNDLAWLLQDQGVFVRARPMHERALAIREKALGPEHPDTATSLDGLATLLREQGDLVGARSLYERALEIREKVLGPAHMATAQSLSNLASLLADVGDLTKARTHYERALAIFEMISPEHPNTNRVRRNFARLLLATGSAAEALTLGETALAAHEKILGKNYHWTRDSAGTAADALAALGRADEAAALRERYNLDRAAPPQFRPLEVFGRRPWRVWKS